MDVNEFREFGKAAVDFIAEYYENIRALDVLPSVSPGYLYDSLPVELSEEPVHWKTILEDIQKFIVPGLTHWQSPNFHAYYPTASSFPSMVGEMLSAAFGVIGFSWICSPACTELEVIVMDWVAKFLNLPEKFLNSSEGPGGGVIQGSASEAILVALLAARETTVRRQMEDNPDMNESDIRGRLVGYSSNQSNSCIEKAGLLGAVPLRLIPVAEDLIMNGKLLKKFVEEDIRDGKIPVICIATMGTTGTCAYDDIESLSSVCTEYKMWCHVDGAYAGIALGLPEMRDQLSINLETVDSFNYNLHKTMLVNFDACAMWLSNAEHLTNSFNVDRIYLKHNNDISKRAPEYRHWQIPLGRRFRALKIWITLRTFGAEGIRNHFRNFLSLAKYFEQKVLSDARFELVTKTTLGLVCFRLKGENHLTTDLLERITERKKIYLIQAAHGNRKFLRFVICGNDAKTTDIDFAWNEIVQQTDKLLQSPIHSYDCKSEEKELHKDITTQISTKLHITVNHEKTKS